MGLFSGVTNWLSNVQQYDIELDRKTGVYIAGEKITGRLKLKIKEGKEIKCRGIRVKLQGKGYSHLKRTKTDSDGNTETEHYYSNREYVNKTVTAFGNFYATECIDGCGSDAVFDVNSGGGEIPINLPKDKSAEDMLIVVRAMDMDWGKKDDLLGEILIKPGKDLLLNGEPQSFDCKRRGKKEKGEITLSATIVTRDDESQYLDLKCIKATGLRAAEMFSFLGNKNDVYVQAYMINPEYEESNKVGLPEPTINTHLPGGFELDIPFQMKLPEKGLPSSFECGGLGWGEQSYVRYSIVSNIDIAWWGDPSSRQFITVLAGELPPISLFNPLLKPAAPATEIYGCDCLCLKCFDKGSATMNVCIDKSYIAPNERLWMTAFIRNGTEDACHLRVFLHLYGIVSAGGISNRQIDNVHKSYEIYTEQVPGGGVVIWPSDNPKAIMCPMIPPTYQGLPEEKKKSVLFKRVDPVIWYYQLEVKLDMPGMMATDIKWRVPFVVGAWPIKLLQEMYPDMYAKTFEAIESAGIANEGEKSRYDEETKDYDSNIIDKLLGYCEPDNSIGFAGIDEKEDSHSFNINHSWRPSYPKPPEDMLCPKPSNLPTMPDDREGKEEGSRSASGEVIAPMSMEK